MRPVLDPIGALLLLLLPDLALAQQTTTPAAPGTTQHCEQARQVCIRRCTGADLQPCFMNCAENHAYCLQNPTATRRPQPGR